MMNSFVHLTEQQKRVVVAATAGRHRVAIAHVGNKTFINELAELANKVELEFGARVSPYLITKYTPPDELRYGKEIMSRLDDGGHGVLVVEDFSSLQIETRREFLSSQYETPVAHNLVSCTEFARTVIGFVDIPYDSYRSLTDFNVAKGQMNFSDIIYRDLLDNTPTRAFSFKELVDETVDLRKELIAAGNGVFAPVELRDISEVQYAYTHCYNIPSLQECSKYVLRKVLALVNTLRLMSDLTMDNAFTIVRDLSGLF